MGILLCLFSNHKPSFQPFWSHRWRNANNQHNKWLSHLLNSLKVLPAHLTNAQNDTALYKSACDRACKHTLKHIFNYIPCKTLMLSIELCRTAGEHQGAGTSTTLKTIAGIYQCSMNRHNVQRVQLSLSLPFSHFPLNSISFCFTVIGLDVSPSLASCSTWNYCLLDDASQS